MNGKTTILVFSDSHHNNDSMLEVISRIPADLIIHLGDCTEDAAQIRRRFPDIPVENVPGNCDFGGGPGVRILKIAGKKIMICHGHQYNVKNSSTTIIYAALEKKVDAVLFGHTHKIFYDYYNGLYIMNPGSIGAPPFSTPESFGMITIEGHLLQGQTMYAKDVIQDES